jgi:hypothetical protein
MKPEYQFKVEKLTDKEKVLDGLLSSGHIVSCEQKFGHYEISVYGKQRVDGKGGKPTDWFNNMDKPPGDGIYIKTPYYPSTTAYLGTASINGGSIQTNSTITSSLNTDNAKLKEEMNEIIKKAIDNNYGC